MNLKSNKNIDDLDIKGCVFL